MKNSCSIRPFHNHSFSNHITGRDYELTTKHLHYELYHFPALITNIKAFFLLFAVMFSCNVLCASDEAAGIEREIDGRTVLFTAHDSELLTAVDQRGSLEKFRGILAALAAFEEQFHRIKVLDKCNVVFEINERSATGDVFGELIVDCEYPGSDMLAAVRKTFRIHGARFDEAGTLVFARFAQEGEGESRGAVFDLYTMLRDKKGNVRKCMFLKFEYGLKLEGQADFLKFINGRWLEYGPYLQFNKPVSLTVKTFQVDRKGWKIWTHVSKHMNRGFNDKGQLVRETKQETSYNYSRSVKDMPYDIYDLAYYRGGDIKSFDLVFKDGLKPSANRTEPEHMDVYFRWSPEGILLEKMVRSYRILDNKREYVKGISREYMLADRKRAVKLTETSFSIRPGTDGSMKENRIPEKTVVTWNISFDKNDKVLSRKVLEVTHSFEREANADEPAIVFRGLKDVKFVDDEGRRLKGVFVDYYDFSGDGTLSIVRSIVIDVLSYNRSGDPATMVLSILSPENPGENTEMRIVQDCNYIIGEAVLGDMFLEKREKGYYVCLDEIPEGGENFQGTVIHGNPGKQGSGGDNGAYFLQENP